MNPAALYLKAAGKSRGELRIANCGFEEGKSKELRAKGEEQRTEIRDRKSAENCALRIAGVLVFIENASVTNCFDILGRGERQHALIQTGQGNSVITQTYRTVRRW